MHYIQNHINTGSGRELSKSPTRGSLATIEKNRCLSEVSGTVSDRVSVDTEANWADHPAGALAALRAASLGSTGSTPLDEMVSECAERKFEKSHIQVEASVLSLSHCDRFCLCQCHQVTNLATPNHLGKILGRLFIGYIGLPLLSHRRCNVVTCRNERSQTRIRITYLFPFWFALRQVALTFTKVSSTFMWTLNFPVITQTSCPMIVHASLGSIEDVQGLLATDAAVLNAIDIISSKSPLHVGLRARNCDGVSDEHREQVALQCRQADLVRFLIQQGADVFVQDCNKK